jgi:hypothetical protein
VTEGFWNPTEDDMAGDDVQALWRMHNEARLGALFTAAGWDMP